MAGGGGKRDTKSGRGKRQRRSFESMEALPLRPQKKKTQAAAEASDRMAVSDDDCPIQCTTMSWQTGSSGTAYSAITEKYVRAEQHEAEAARIIERSTFYDVPQVLALAKPRDAGAKSAAEAAAGHISEVLEADLEAGTPQSDAELTRLVLDDLRARLRTAANDRDRAALALIARQWTHNHAGFMQPDGLTTTLDAFMDPPAMAFIMYVQSQIKDLHVAVGAPTRGVGTRTTPAQPKDACLTAARLLLPSAENQFTPDGFGEDEQIDFALLNCPVGGKPELQSEAQTNGFFAIVNCEANQDYREHSLKQLVASTRHVYQVQHNRVFAWALSVCGTLVYAVVMLHDAVLVSPAMDVSTPAGRKQFVELLVDWAACDDVQAGYDPTIVDDLVRGCFRIECPDENGTPRWYTATRILVAAEDVLGSHTRYYAAKPDDADGASDMVLIKDAFVRSSLQPDGSACEETRLLRRVENTFGGEADFQHPRLVRSGNVKLPTGGSYVSGVAHNGVYDFGNNTDTILSVMGAARQNVPAPGNDGNPAGRSWTQQPHRVCRRLVMAPYGEPLSTVSSEAELIVILADVMRCHTAIRDRLQILHRDISPNNIMVTRGADGLPHGLLVGYDSAIPADDGGRSARPDRLGALPYTSIWNLEGGNKRQTALDDCEAMLYILCMLGTLGVTNDQRTNDTRDLEDMPISQWSANTPKKIARIKREHMDSEENFREEILEYFHPECVALGLLAEDLHRALFLHEGCAGARAQRPKVTGRSVVDVLRNPLAAQQSLERQDPLDQRLMHEDAIVEALTRVMAKYDEPAKQVLRERQANAQAAASPASIQEATTTMETLCMWDGSSTPIWVPPAPSSSSSSSPKRKSRGRSRGKKPMLLDKVV